MAPNVMRPAIVTNQFVNANETRTLGRCAAENTFGTVVAEHATVDIDAYVVHNGNTTMQTRILRIDHVHTIYEKIIHTDNPGTPVKRKLSHSAEPWLIASPPG